VSFVMPPDMSSERWKMSCSAIEFLAAARAQVDRLNTVHRRSRSCRSRA
jgi:hypothetical protein